MDYNETIALPKTQFPMRAGLPKREPEILERWEKLGLYERIQEKNAGRPLFILHDGPPFSNGDIHIGTAMNKVLKDIIIRYKNMSGYASPYVPGWDNHGMPIESAIIKKKKLNRKDMSIPQFRDECQAFAQDFVERHRKQFKRLGVLGDWERPYLTMAKEFEACETRVFGKMYEKGYIYKGLKPVYWCAHDETALAEAEIEYQDSGCLSVYVKFRVSDDRGLFGTEEPVHIVIWTTTIWTLPGNVAICLHPDIEYTLIRADGTLYLLAGELVDKVAAVAGWTNIEKLKSYKGRDLERVTARHPFLDRDSLVILGQHVTLEAGTGCVHTAPGHGAEDYYACISYKLPIIVPVDAKGRMTEEAGSSAGLPTMKANEVILEELKAKDALLCTFELTHSYPHCWRCHSPVIYRATEQWFSSVDAMRDEAVASADSVNWLPEWGAERMRAMVRERADWCISRQRHWGLPIPAFYCDECHKPVVTPESIEAVAELFEREGSNAWYSKEASEILPDGFSCPHCGARGGFSKGTDTLDGWFDSGSSHAAVLKKRDYLSWPADVYIEGGDQFRGWFQSSLLTAVATEGVAPYKLVITHGWTVDGQGRKMSKSLGNGVEPGDIINTSGADILRLWVASTDYHTDMRVSPDIIKQLADVYLKIRNTARFMLGNLRDGSFSEPVSYDELSGVDRWALHRLTRLIEQVTEYYERYEYHTIYHAIHNFCVIDMSNFYLDIIKDRLYCDGKNSISRRACLTVLDKVLDALCRLCAPILSFTMDEIWQYMGRSEPSVHLCDMPKPNRDWLMEGRELEKWNRISALRLEINKALELSRAEGLIGKSLEAHVTVAGSAELYELIKDEPLKAIFIVSELEYSERDGGGEAGITVKRAGGGKCDRCWTYSTFVGSDANHPTLCERCAGVVNNAEGS